MATSRANSKKSSSHAVVYVALVGNTLVALSKFIAAALTGSSAMLSEGIHSLVDTTNELLLLYGLRRGAAEPDDEHPLGYGREVYFWSFVVAILIFTAGAGASIYEGIKHILNPAPIQDAHITYIVLLLAAIFEGTSWIYTIKAFKGSRRYSELFGLVRRSKDPPTFIVLLEDSAAMVGILIAFLGVYASMKWGVPELDGLASIFIGLTLALTAVVLARETKGLLIGEAADQQTRQSILRITEHMPGVAHANGLITVHVAPQEIIATLSVEFEDYLRTPEIEELVVQLERRVHAQHPMVTAVFVKPQTQARYRAQHADLNP